MDFFKFNRRQIRDHFKQEAKLVIVGLDNAGKTTMLKSMAQEETGNICPTTGINRKSIIQDGVKLNVMDLGGQRELRPYWNTHLKGGDGINGIIYVVDSSDEVRFQESKMELDNLLIEDELFNIPLLVFANKQDIETALDSEQIVDELCLLGI